VNLDDPQLSFVLDAKPVAAQTLAIPMELKLGRHELLVKRGDEIKRHFVVEVKRTGFALDEEPLKPRPPVGTETLQEKKSKAVPEGVVATEKHKTGLLVDIVRIHRTSDGFLTIRWRYRNPTDKDVLLFNWHGIGLAPTNNGWLMLQSLYFIE